MRAESTGGPRRGDLNRHWGGEIARQDKTRIRIGYVSMKRRWIIRSFFIGLLLLFAVGWSFSFRYDWQIEYFGKGEWTLGSNWRELRFGYVRLGDSGKFFWTCDDASPERNGTGIAGVDFSLVKATEHLGVVGLQLPVAYWHATCISGLALRLVWRKTRPKVDPRTAFPVELSKETKTP